MTLENGCVGKDSLLYTVLVMTVSALFLWFSCVRSWCARAKPWVPESDDDVSADEVAAALGKWKTLVSHSVRWSEAASDVLLDSPRYLASVRTTKRAGGFYESVVSHMDAQRALDTWIARLRESAELPAHVSSRVPNFSMLPRVRVEDRMPGQEYWHDSCCGQTCPLVGPFVLVLAMALPPLILLPITCA
jgi:hypothetical protein